jgi:hypothetical protein
MSMTKTFLPKPVSMVVASTMHTAATFRKPDIGAILQAALNGTKQPEEPYVGPEEVARGLLHSIAMECSLNVVLAALKSAGAPSTMEDIGDALKTLRDEQVRVP